MSARRNRRSFIRRAVTNVDFKQTTQPAIVENVANLVLTNVYENGAPMIA